MEDSPGSGGVIVQALVASCLIFTVADGELTLNIGGGGSPIIGKKAQEPESFRLLEREMKSVVHAQRKYLKLHSLPQA